MTVKHIETMDEWAAVMETSKTKVVVVDFSAAWCGPCKVIGPVFEKLSDQTPSIEFVKVDVDEAEEIAANCGISAMPTFQFYKNGQKVEEMLGADGNRLQELIAKYSS